MNRPCRDVETSIGRPTHSLSEAEGLRLEQHLGECDACRRESDLARSVAQLVMTSPSTLSESARERAIAASFARAQVRTAQISARPRLRSVGIAVAAAAVLALGLRFGLSGNEDAAVPLASHVVAPVAPTIEPAQEAAAILPTADTWIETGVAETRRFAHAQVKLAPHSRVRFDPASSTLELAQGRAAVDVDPSKHAPFAVLTSTFRVQVLGTQFVVTPESVEVLHGRVSITNNQDASDVRELVAGKTYRHGARSTARASKTAPSKTSSAELLRQARSALAQGEPATARALIERVEQGTATRGERAEAGTLSAECSMLERKPAQALAAYLAVADQYGSLAAGQNALFAAAQLSQPQDPAQARSLLERYLRRYPRGRFVEEARARLGKLTP